VAGGGMAEVEGLHDDGEVEGDDRRQEATAAAASAVAGHGDGGRERGGKRVHVGLSPPRPWRRRKHRHRRPCWTPGPRGSPSPCSFCRGTSGGLDGIGRLLHQMPR
jgi:hypothetical protein